jgi:hypothetical protein
MLEQEISPPNAGSCKGHDRVPDTAGRQAISLDLPTVYPRQAGRNCKPGGQQDAETVEALL